MVYAVLIITCYWWEVFMSSHVDLKRAKEKEIVGEMIGIYCRKNHKWRGFLCPECTELKAYAFTRADKCPFMENKTFCSNCEVHCYEPTMRARIREVMRFSGRRLFFRHPILVVKHLAYVLDK